MVEQSDQMFGGTCINVACLRTKAFVHQAEIRRDATGTAAQSGSELPWASAMG